MLRLLIIDLRSVYIVLKVDLQPTTEGLLFSLHLLLSDSCFFIKGVNRNGGSSVRPHSRSIDRSMA